jgi:hypothetical protein
MEFDEMKQIWDSQSNQMLFAIDEQALHNRILSKKSRARHTANFTEWLLIVVNLATGIFVTTVQQFNNTRSVFVYLMAAWAILTAGFVIVSRIRRTRDVGQFNRTMLGDLDHAISDASYQVRISFIMRWNIVPIGLFILLSFWEQGTPLWIAILVLVLFAASYYASGWEHGIYEKRKRELEVLRTKLSEEKTVEGA